MSDFATAFGERPFIFLVDMDNVLYDWDALFWQEVGERYPHVSVPDRAMRLDYNPMVNAPLLTPEQKQLIFDLPGFYGRIPVMEGAQEAMAEISSLKGVITKVCSAPTATNPTCASDKLAALAKDFSPVLAHSAVLKWDKTTEFGDVLLDDKPKITGALPKPFWEHVVFDHPYNAATPGRRLYHWSEWASVVPELLTPSAKGIAYV